MKPDEIPDQFVQAMVVAGEVHNRPVNTNLIQIYAQLLTDLNLLDCSDAVMELLQQSRFFPKPADIRNLIVGDSEERALNQWHKVKIWLSDKNYPPDSTSIRIVEELGGYANIGLMRADIFEKYIRRDFIAEYKNALKHERRKVIGATKLELIE